MLSHLPCRQLFTHSLNLGFIHLSDHFFHFSKSTEDYDCHMATKWKKGKEDVEVLVT